MIATDSCRTCANNECAVFNEPCNKCEIIGNRTPSQWKSLDVENYKKRLLEQLEGLKVKDNGISWNNAIEAVKVLIEE